MKSRCRYYLPLFLLFAVALTYQTRFSMDAVRELMYPTEEARRPLDLEQTSSLITVVETEAKQAGVRNGDRLLSVNGQSYTGSKILNVPIEQAHPGDALAVRVQHAEGQQESITITLAPVLSESRGLGDWLAFAILFLVMPIFCVLLGLWVATIRPRDPLAWILLCLMLSFSVFLPRVNSAGWEAGLRQLGVFYSTLFITSWPLWMLLFGLYFPERLDYDRRYPWAKWLLMIPLLIFSLADVIVELGSVENFAAVASLDRLLQPLGKVILIFHMIPISLFFIALGAKLGTATSPDVRRRLKLLRTGAMISFAPTFLLVPRSASAEIITTSCCCPAETSASLSATCPARESPPRS